MAPASRMGTVSVTIACGCPTAFCKGNRSDKYLDEMGGIGIVMRGAEYPLFSVSHFPSRAGGFEKLFLRRLLRQEREHSREPFHVAENVAGNGRFRDCWVSPREDNL